MVWQVGLLFSGTISVRKLITFLGYQFKTGQIIFKHWDFNLVVLNVVGTQAFSLLFMNAG